MLLTAAPATISAARVRPTLAGAAGDIFDDLGGLAPAALRGRHWHLAAAVALGVAILITAAGVVQNDPYDGAIRGLLDAIACIAGFTVLGRLLGLRPARA